MGPLRRRLFGSRKTDPRDAVPARTSPADDLSAAISRCGTECSDKVRADLLRAIADKEFFESHRSEISRLITGIQTLACSVTGLASTLAQLGTQGAAWWIDIQRLHDGDDPARSVPEAAPS